MTACSRCHANEPRSLGQRYCAPCHALAQKKYRVELRGEQRKFGALAELSRGRPNVSVKHAAGVRDRTGSTPAALSASGNAEA